MTVATTYLLALGFLFAFLLAVVPGRRALDLGAGITLLGVGLVAPQAMCLLLAMTIGLPLLMRMPAMQARRHWVTLWCVSIAIGLLVLTRFFEPAIWLGASYFVLRHVHVVIEWWLGRIAAPSIREHVHFQLFLPVLVAGPIHRLPAFTRQIARRSVTQQDIYMGLERVLLGLGSVVIVANWALRRLSNLADELMVNQSLFLQDWLEGTFSWLQIFFGFGGFSAIAIGLSRIGGIQIEENFRAPWRAVNLVDFWTRWHISLSTWCRDYLYTPIAARFRAPVAGALVSMIGMGLWHDFSAYYLVWGVWQGTGIALTQILVRQRIALAPWLLSVSVPLWLTLTQPIINAILRN